MKAKRILYVEGNVDGTVGGSYYVLYDLVINLDKTRYCPVVLFYFDNFVATMLREKGIETYILQRPEPFIFPLKNSKNLMGKTLYQCFRPLQRIINIAKRLLIPAIQLRRFLKTKKIDLVDLNNSVTRNHEWMLAAQLAGVACMTHVMGINKHFSWMSRFFASRMKAIITVSRQVQSNMQQHGLDYPHIITIHNGIDLNRYQISRQPNDVRKQFNIPEQIPLIGVIGNIKYWKGQETVIRATALIKKEFPDIRCLLVGAVAKNDLEYYEYLVKLIEDLSLKETVIFTGFQNNPLDFINTMDIVIHPSIDPEPFGIINLEAMYLSKPVISTTIGAPPEIFENTVSGVLIDPGNPEILARECLLLLRFPEKAKKLGQNGYKRLMSNFTIDINVKKTENIYDKLLFQKETLGGFDTIHN